MTETLQRPARPTPSPRSEGPTVVRAGLRSALRAAAAGLLPVALVVLVLWAADGRAGAGAADALRTAGQLWLVAHGASLEVPGGGYGLTPLGLLVLPLWLLSRSARGVAPGDLVRHALAVAVPYSAVAAVVAAGSATAAVRPGLLSAAGGALAVAVAAAVLGARPSVPERWRATGRAVLTASAVLLGAGALLVGTALAVHLPRAADFAASSGPGVVGGLGLLLAGLALVPNAAVWGAAWLVGPGFAVGVGTGVGPFGHELGPVPALPLLAALPGSAVPGWCGPLVLLVPLLAGALAGRCVQRAQPDASARRVCADAALAAVATGALWAVLARLSGGPVGGERLSQVGPGPVAVGLAVTAVVGAGALGTAALLRYRARP